MTTRTPLADTVHTRIVAWPDYAFALTRVRFEVFVDEQQVPESLELDGLDPDCLHAAAISAGEVIGTGRLLADGRIGRMAVLRGWRHAGVGSCILEVLIESARQRGDTEVRLASQLDAVGFYQRQGFVASGEVFMDAGIPHRTMRLEL